MVFNFNKLTIIVLAIGMFINSNLLFANTNSINPDTSKQITSEHEKKEISLGEIIFDHILDSYSWHIFTYKETHVAIPLPIIIYSKTKGLNIFMSNKFHHGHSEYKGFKLALEGSNKGKVVEIMPDGSEKKSLDFSITKNVVSLFIGIAIILIIFLSIAKRYKQNPDKAPKGLQNAIEPIILFVRDDVARPIIGEHKYEKFMPYLLTIFFFIWINNSLGLIPIFPGGANLTGNISITMVLALFTFTISVISSNKHYWIDIINTKGVPWWLKLPIPIMPFVEIFSFFNRPFILMVRLFANITGGHIAILGFISLIFIFAQINPFIGYSVSIFSVGFAIFMGMIELLVAFIQAYVFTLLSALYFGMASAEDH